MPRRTTADWTAVADAYFRARRGGRSVSESARAAGTAPVTVYRWLRQGKQEPDSPYGKFRQIELEIRERSGRSVRTRVTAAQELDQR
jgi:hypothetical protein